MEWDCHQCFNYILKEDFEVVIQFFWIKLVLLELMTNPFLVMFDIPAICDIVKEKGSQAKVLVDNTVLTPYFMVRESGTS